MSLNLVTCVFYLSGHVGHSPQHPPSPVYVSDFRAAITGDRCSVSGLAGAVDVHVSTVPLAQQSHSETTCHPGGQSNSNRPLVAITAVVPTPALTVCGQPSLLPIPPRSTVTTGIHLRHTVVPSALMEALMQHYQAAALSEEVSRLAAAQIAYMTTGGFASLTGPQGRDLIR